MTPGTGYTVQNSEADPSLFYFFFGDFMLDECPNCGYPCDVFEAPCPNCGFIPFDEEYGD